MLTLDYLALLCLLILLAGALWLAWHRLSGASRTQQRLIDTVPVGFYELRTGLDQQPVVVYMSQQALNLLGWPDDGSNTLPLLAAVLKRVHPQDRESFIKAAGAGLERDEAFQLEFRVRAQGQIRWLQSVCTPAKAWRRGKFWSGYLIDMTEARVAQARFQAVFEQSPVAILVQDPESGAVLEANPQAWRDYGFESSEAFLEQQASTWLQEPPHTLKDAAGKLRQVVEQGRPITFEWCSLRRDGMTIWHEVKLTQLNYAEEKRVLALCTDITARRQSEQRLRESEARFRLLLENLPGVAVQGYLPDGTVQYWNRASEELYGYSSEEALGHTLLELIVPPEKRQLVAQDLQRAQQGNPPDNGEIELMRKDGSRVLVHSSHSMVERDGQPAELFCIDLDLTERKQHEAELSHAANHDKLTGLPNRPLLGEMMNHMLARSDRNGIGFAVCYLDLDEFKPVNDTYGHEAGDMVLVELANRLQGLVRRSDVVARLGGDEFVLLLEGLDSGADLQTRLQAILTEVAQPIRLPQGLVQVQASIGVTLYPQDAADPDTLLRHADQAMYEAKSRGRNRFRMFDPRLDEEVARRGQRQREIEEGLQAGQFVLHYQPQVDMQSGALLGLEALVRWQHPERGLVMPLEFLGDLTDLELECRFGDYVIEQALRQQTYWQAVLPDCPLSINISARHLLSAGFYDSLEAAFRRHPGAQPDRFALEILESAAVEDLDQAVAVLQRCRRLGVHVALDDFGTGYSSLLRLRRLPVHTVKIDQSFVRNMLTNRSDYSIVKSVIGLANAFELELMAEGVESSEHVAELLSLGCRGGQGYIFAAPMPPEALPDWLRDWQQPAGV